MPTTLGNFVSPWHVSGPVKWHQSTSFDATCWCTWLGLFGGCFSCGVCRNNFIFDYQSFIYGNGSTSFNSRTWPLECTPSTCSCWSLFESQPNSNRTSREFGDFCREAGIELSLPAEKEPWSHGLVEKAGKDIKHTASCIHVELQGDPATSLILACSALNSTEHVSGYTPHQWAFGRDYTISYLLSTQWSSHLCQYLDFELNKLPTRPDPRESWFDLATLVFDNHFVTSRWLTWWWSGGKSYLNMFIKDLVVEPRELLINPGLDLVELSWLNFYLTKMLMILAATLCGFLSMGNSFGAVFIQLDLWHLRNNCTMTSNIEKILLDGNPLLTSCLDVNMRTSPQRYLRRRRPRCLPYLINLMKPPWYLHVEHILRRPSYLKIGRQSIVHRLLDLEVRALRLLGLDLALHLDLAHRAQDELDLILILDLIAFASPWWPCNVSNSQWLWAFIPASSWGTWSQAQLSADAQHEVTFMDVFSALMDCEEVLTIEFSLHVESHRQRKMLERNPVLYMNKKMNSAQVRLERLSTSEKQLFERAKMKEVDSFLKNEAIRKCLDDDEVKRAFGSNRIIKARWVLTWKSTPPDELEEAQAEAKKSSSTVLTHDGSKKAKARIVLLGFQHPSLLDPTFKTAAPVQSMIGRNLIYQLSVQNPWELHGLDLATAFLQTQPTEADQEIWTTGVKELRQALGVCDDTSQRVRFNNRTSCTMAFSPQNLGGNWSSAYHGWEMLVGLVFENCQGFHQSISSIAGHYYWRSSFRGGLQSMPRSLRPTGHCQTFQLPPCWTWPEDRPQLWWFL